VRRLLLVLAMALAAPGVADAACAPPDTGGHVEAVFAYRATERQARAAARDVARRGFRFVEVEHVDCGLWQVMLEGLDTPRQQREFAREATDAGYPGLSYDAVHGSLPRPQPGTVRAVFGRFRTVAAADARLRRVAGAGFRFVNVFRRGDEFVVEVVGVPLAKTQEFARQARSVRLAVSFDL
jgi:hypothetical protein